MKTSYEFEVCYLDMINIQRDKKIKKFVKNLFKNGFHTNAEWIYQEAAIGEIPYRWIGWELDKELDQEERSRIVLTIGTFLNEDGVFITKI